MTIFESFRCIKQYASDHLVGFDMTCYTVDSEQLTNEVAWGLRDLLYSKGMVYGQEAPEISDDEFFDLIKTFEKP